MHRSNLHPAFEPPVATTLVELLQANAAAIGDKQVFAFVRGDGQEDASLTYRALHERAMAIGGELQTLAAPGDRALLLFPPGLDFIATFMGCLYAGVVAVPVAPPARKRSTASLEAIVKASNPVLILSTADHCELAQRSYAHLSTTLLNRRWLATDKIDTDRRFSWRDPGIDSRQPAFLQFTSGSTSSPKGVVLSHGNVMSNASLIRQAFGNTSDSRGVFWLPQYHDMGLIGGVVQPIYCGGSATLMAPAAFLQRPALWLETISRTRATVSGGPDFAYNVCARKIPADQRAQLDLSSWQVAFTGAERVRAETIDRFCAAFAASGFRRESFFPCYGLAEATLMVSGGPRQTAPAIAHVRADLLAVNRVETGTPGASSTRTLVGCGESLPGQRTLIVDPHTCVPCADGDVGEIWVQGASVSTGYHCRPEATQAAFGGFLDNTGEGPFLRTGDLGFVRGGQLFVTGRMKDVIIIRGRNYYPEDIEHSMDGAHPAFRAGSCVAFSIDDEDRERLVVVQELEPRQRHVDTGAALQAIRAAVAQEHELEVHAALLVKAGEIPKTSSGKTQRSTCRERYQNGEFEIVAEWKANDETTESEAAEPHAAEPRTVTVGEAENWLIHRIAERLGLAPAQVHVTTPFLEFGMGSLDAVEIAADLERWLGRRMSPTAIYNYPNVAALASWIASSQAEVETPAASHASLAFAVTPPEQILDDVRNMSDDDMQAFLLQEMAKLEAK